MNLQDLCERIVRDAIPATDSGATCFVPRYQIDQLREALSAPQPTSGGACHVPWIEEWQGSGPQRGYHIREATHLHNNRVVAYLGDQVSGDEVDKLIAEHNGKHPNGEPVRIPSAKAWCDENAVATTGEWQAGWDACRVEFPRPAPPSAPVGVEGLHPETADLVHRFAQALAEKLAAAERKYGWSTHWKSPDWMDQCREQLVDHVAKGDPRDVAAYAAFLWHHGEPTALAQQPVTCDMGALCIGCEPRNADGSCPGQQPAAVPALEVFRIAGGDIECDPNPTPERALEVLRDLRVCYDEVLAQQPAAVDGAMAGWIADGDTIPAHLIEATRDAIRLEFGNNGTDGYYKRILVRVFTALAAQPGGSGNDQ